MCASIASFRTSISAVRPSHVSARQPPLFRASIARANFFCAKQCHTHKHVNQRGGPCRTTDLIREVETTLRDVMEAMEEVGSLMEAAVVTAEDLPTVRAAVVRSCVQQQCWRESTFE